MTQISTDINKLNDLSYKIIGCTFKVHKSLGPGLLESAYEACMFYELINENLLVERQKELPLVYNSVKLDTGYRIDLLVENCIIVEIKSIETLAPIHDAQVLTYLKLSKVKMGLLINFNTVDVKKGIKD